MSRPEKPTKYPEWASDDVRHPLNNEYNVYEPPEQKKALGWDLHEAPPRQWLNWLFRLIHQWIVYFDYFLHRPKTYLRADLPKATECQAQLLFVSDLDGGVLVFSNGQRWHKINSSEEIKQ